MFDPNTDRSDYGKLLAPPAGYTLEFAVGTTYSLDLNALVGACMSLSLGEETDSELLDDPIYILHTLLGTGKKLALFCEGGQIKFPQKANKLHALLESAVFDVAMPKSRGTAYPSFHPKMWLLRYKNDDMGPVFRVIVLSRNLTFDRSWDVVFSMDGTFSEEPTGKNAPLGDFLAFLADCLPKTPLGKEKKQNITHHLISDLDRVRFEINKPFTDYEFLPVGIDRTPTDIRSVLQLSAKKYDDLFVMSPFLSNGEIKALDELAGEKAVLITRRESLPRLRAEDCMKFEIFCMRDDVVNGEGKDSDGKSEDIGQQDIHAKLYLSRKYSVDLFLGSMNASHNALAGNIEFMIHLKTHRRYLSLDRIKGELFGEGGAKSPFEQIDLATITQEESAADSRLDKIVKAICRARPYASVAADGESYRVKVTVPNCEKIDFLGAEVSICPLFSARQKHIAETIWFEGLSLGELTSFYRISAKKGEESLERVIIAPTEGIPEERDETIVSSVVCDQKSFVKYLSFLLGDEPALSALEATRSGGGRSARTQLPTALYEKMLSVAAREPARFKEIDFLVKTLRGKDIIPPEFEQLYATFTKVVKTNG